MARRPADPRFDRPRDDSDTGEDEPRRDRARPPLPPSHPHTRVSPGFGRGEEGTDPGATAALPPQAPKRAAPRGPAPAERRTGAVREREPGEPSTRAQPRAANAPPREPAREPPRKNDGRTRILDAREPPAKGVARGELIVRAGPVAGLKFALHTGVVVVGRSSQVNCCIPDEAVSRRHFELRVTSSGVQLRDLGSGNGTLVNGDKVEEAFLKNGDKIVVGDTTIEFRDNAQAPKTLATRLRGGGAPAAGTDGEPQTWFLARLPAKQRRLVAFSAVLIVVFLLFSILWRMQSNRTAQEARALEAFHRGEAALEADPPDPDTALDDFSAASHGYQDAKALRDKKALATRLSEGMAALRKAHELIDQKEYEAARRPLAHLPEGEYFARVAKMLNDQIDSKTTQQKLEQEAQKETIDPTTLAEARDLTVRAKRAEASAPDLAAQLYDQAYQMLAQRGASGPDFNQIRDQYINFLLSEAGRLRRRNPRKSAAMEQMARTLGTVATPPPAAGEQAPPEAAAPMIHPMAVAPAPSAPRPKRAHAAPQTARRRAPPAPTASAPPAPAAAPAAAPAEPRAAAAPRYDEDKAGQLCDEGDALIGQDPDGAKKKYREALRYAEPGGESARHAQEGLNN